MGRKSAGVLMYRFNGGVLEVLLGHMGGPFWAKKDEHAWSIPKGEFNHDEQPLQGAKREFEEETGYAPQGEFLELTPRKQSGGKEVMAWAVEGDWDPSTLVSNTFTMEWPPRSGKEREFPEIDRAEWFPLDVARRKVVRGQIGFIDELHERLGSGES